MAVDLVNGQALNRVPTEVIQVLKSPKCKNVNLSPEKACKNKCQTLFASHTAYAHAVWEENNV